MKLKGIHPVEQHVEKMVLGVAAIGLLAGLAWQFVGSPNSVDVGNGKRVPPGGVFASLETEATTLLGQLQDETPSLPELTTPALGERFEAALAAAATPEGGRVAALGRGVAIEVSGDAAATGPVMAARVPAPGKPLATSQWGTADPAFAARYPAIAALLPESQPYDVPVVSVEVAFDGTALDAALRSADEGRRPVPLRWWSGGVEVLDVEVERQEQLADGSWGEASVVPQPAWWPELLEGLADPSKTSWRAPVGTFGAPQTAAAETMTWGSLSLDELRDLARLAATDPSLVSRPPMFPMISGPSWVAPTQVAVRDARAVAADEAAGVVADVVRTQERIADLERRMQEGPRQREEPASRESGGGRRAGGGGRPPSARPAPDPADDRQRLTPEERFRQQFEARIADERAEIERLDARLAELGFDRTEQNQLVERPADATAGTGGSGGTGGLGAGFASPDSRGGIVSSGFGEARERLLSSTEYPVWSHDAGVEPGRVYRYRLRVLLNNPLYQRERSLGTEDPEMIALAGQPLVASPWSEWSDPVEVGRASYYFVTAASDAGELGKSIPTATAEVYRMYYGYYRRQTATLEPGDVVRADFRLPEGLVTFDVAGVDEAALRDYYADLADYRAKTGEAAAQPIAVAPPSVRDEERGGGRFAPGGPAQPPPTVAGGGTASGDDGDELTPPELPPGVTAVADRLPLRLGVALLDVASIPGAREGSRGADTHEAYFFDPLAGIVIRRPSDDRSLTAYREVSVSARAGEKAALNRLWAVTP